MMKQKLIEYISEANRRNGKREYQYFTCVKSVNDSKYEYCVEGLYENYFMFWREEDYRFSILAERKNLMPLFPFFLRKIYFEDRYKNYKLVNINSLEIKKIS